GQAKLFFRRVHCLNSSAKCPQSRQSGDTAAVTQPQRIYRTFLGWKPASALRLAVQLAAVLRSRRWAGAGWAAQWKELNGSKEPGGHGRVETCRITRSLGPALPPGSAPWFAQLSRHLPLA